MTLYNVEDDSDSTGTRAPLKISLDTPRLQDVALGNEDAPRLRLMFSRELTPFELTWMASDPEPLVGAFAVEPGEGWYVPVAALLDGTENAEAVAQKLRQAVEAIEDKGAELEQLALSSLSMLQDIVVKIDQHLSTDRP